MSKFFLLFKILKNSSNIFRFFDNISTSLPSDILIFSSKSVMSFISLSRIFESNKKFKYSNFKF